MLDKSRKGFSEITSFVLLFALVSTASTLVYAFSRNVIDDKIADIDLDNMGTYFKIMSQKFNTIENFDSASSYINIRFKKGEVMFNSTSVYYQSLVKYVGTDYCLDSVCHYSSSGYERIVLTIGPAYNFSADMRLSPGDYLISFQNIKNESKIQIGID